MISPPYLVRLIHIIRDVLLAFLLSATSPIFAVAQESEVPFQIFDRLCLSAKRGFADTLSLASERGWQKLPPEAMGVLSPFIEPAQAVGWIVSGPDAPMQVLVVSEGSRGPSLTVGCTVGFFGIDTEKFDRALETRLGFKPQDEDRDSDRLYRKWLTGNPERLVTESLPLTAGASGQVVATVISTEADAQ